MRCSARRRPARRCSPRCWMRATYMAHARRSPRTSSACRSATAGWWSGRRHSAARWPLPTPGEPHVALLMPNAIASVVAFMGMQAFGVVPCLLNVSAGAARDVVGMPRCRRAQRGLQPHLRGEGAARQDRGAHGRGGAVRLAGGRPCGDRPAREAACQGWMRGGRAACPAPSPLRTRRRWCCSPADRRARPRAWCSATAT